MNETIYFSNSIHVLKQLFSFIFQYDEKIFCNTNLYFVVYGALWDLITRPRTSHYYPPVMLGICCIWRWWRNVLSSAKRKRQSKSRTISTTGSGRSAIHGALLNLQLSLSAGHSIVGYQARLWLLPLLPTEASKPRPVWRGETISFGR